jgi:Tfp pilus assembly protein PilO
MKLKILFFPIALFVAFMVTIFFTKPEWDIYKDKQAEATLLTSQADDLRSGNDSIINSTKKLEVLTSDQESLVLNAVPKNDNNDDFLAEIHKSAERSGVFIIATKVKSNEIEKSLSSEEESQLLATPLLKSTNAKVTVMGSYIDITEFIKEVDSHNRITMPKELSIITQDVEAVNSSESETELPTAGALIKADVVFDFFNKTENEKLHIASLIRANDPVIKSLLSGQFKSAVIEKYNEKITSEVFRPVGAGSAGKTDIFAN